jgi:hypothetical protein
MKFQRLFFLTQDPSQEGQVFLSFSMRVGGFFFSFPHFIEAVGVVGGCPSFIKELVICEVLSLLRLAVLSSLPNPSILGHSYICSVTPCCGSVPSALGLWDFLYSLASSAMQLKLHLF